VRRIFISAVITPLAAQATAPKAPRNRNKSAFQRPSLKSEPREKSGTRKIAKIETAITLSKNLAINFGFCVGALSSCGACACPLGWKEKPFPLHRDIFLL
jgi:hypothetical protein